MRIGVIGAGYVGLTTAAGLGTLDFARIFVCDNDDERLCKLGNGECPIVEPGLEEGLFNPQGSITFCTPAGFGMLELDVVFICVGTPSCADGSVDTSQIEASVEFLHGNRRKRNLIVIRSTVPPGTTRQMKAYLELQGSPPQYPTGTDMYPRMSTPIVCHHPEFLQQGSALSDFCDSKRNVFGIVDEKDRYAVEGLAQTIYSQPSRIVSTETSELSKYTNNAFLATKISFANEVSRIATTVGACYDDVAAIIGEDPRIGSKFLASGIGFGGSCLPKDIKGLLSVCRGWQIDAPVIRAAWHTNEQVEQALIDVIVHTFGQSTTGERQTLIVDGMTFKSGTDDTRNSIIVSALTTACLAMPNIDLCFVDALASRAGTGFGRLTRLRNGLQLVRSYSEVPILRNYIQIAGVILSQEKTQAGLAHLLLSLHRPTVLDCRPTQEKASVVLSHGANYAPFVG